jgi:hypothetical protein
LRRGQLAQADAEENRDDGTGETAKAIAPTAAGVEGEGEDDKMIVISLEHSPSTPQRTASPMQVICAPRRPAVASLRTFSTSSQPAIAKMQARLSARPAM